MVPAWEPSSKTLPRSTSLYEVVNPVAVYDPSIPEAIYQLPRATKEPPSWWSSSRKSDYEPNRGRPTWAHDNCNRLKSSKTVARLPSDQRKPVKAIDSRYLRPSHAIQRFLSDDGPRYFPSESCLPSILGPWRPELQGLKPTSQRGTSMMFTAESSGQDSLSPSWDLAALVSDSESCCTSESQATSTGEKCLESRHWDLQREPGGTPAEPWGALVVSPYRQPGQLECPFNHILCSQAFTNVDEWIAHSLTHFGTKEPPLTIDCVFCDWRYDSSAGVQSWTERMNHVALHHGLGHSLSHARCDFVLYIYMRKKSLLSERDYMELMGPVVATKS